MSAAENGSPVVNHNLGNTVSTLSTITQYFHFIQYVFSDEPIQIIYEIIEDFLKFYIYCNDEYAIFEDFVAEMDAALESYSLNHIWGKFYARRVELTHSINSFINCWEFISISLLI